MDGGATAAALGAWEAVRGFFTPATLFLTVNLVIGTILLTSRSHQRRRQGGHDGDHQEQPLQQEPEGEQYYCEEYVPPYRPAPLARAPSVLERLRSFSLYRFNSGNLAPELSASPDHAVAAVAAADEKKTSTQYSRSRSEPAREQGKDAAAASAAAADGGGRGGRRGRAGGRLHQQLPEAAAAAAAQLAAQLQGGAQPRRQV
uniref:DUF4408 domain-containing protein n=1 Tax=Aegilops tauschii subsp. strangulata TaxID=200361 RepID=A0A452ZPU0_AEGTS